MADRALRKVQLGHEATAGTAVAATAIWRGPAGMIEDRRQTVFPAEDVGYVSGVDRSYVPKLLAGVPFPETEATFEQLPYILQAGVKDVTPSADGAGTDYISTYDFPTTAENTLETFTIESGDNQEVEEVEYGFVESFKLSGKQEAAWMVSADWLGRQATVSAFTGSLSLPSIEEILTAKTKLYIDDAGGTIGSTQKSATLLGFELNVRTGWFPRFVGDGQKYFSAARFSGDLLEVLLKITFEHDGTSTAEKVNWRSETARLVRLLSEGSAVATGGTTYSNKTAIIDLAGKWETFEKLDEQDGNDIVTGTFRARYNSTAALFAQMVIVNELSALP